MPPRRREGERRSTPTRARQLRSDASTPERVLWSRIRDRQLRGLKFRRQQPIGPYITDFYCHDAEMVVELDGRTHEDRVEADRVRDAWMHARGITVVRIPVWKLSQDLDGIIEVLGRVASRRAVELRRSKRWE
jgi:very-short-patch-repair endonuclease